MISGDEFDDFAEREFADASRILTSDLYHYTSSDAAILGVLATRTIRLSPFHGTNDLWESKSLYPNLEGGSASDDALRTNVWRMWEEIDRHVRGYSKVSCFTQDWSLPESVLNPDALRGWAHLSLWAHYGAGHTGVCLRFDRDLLLAAFEEARHTSVHQFSGPVQYRSAEFGAGPDGISIEQAEEFGIDAVALRYADLHHERIFFRKHADWASESEFRLVRTDLSSAPYYLDVSTALTGVILGDAFPGARLPALDRMLAGLPGVEVLQARFHNRMLSVWPRSRESDPETSSGSDVTATPPLEPGGSGDLAKRLASLAEVERIASLAREEAAPIAERVIRIWRDELEVRPEFRANAARLVFNIHPGIAAISPQDRQRRPGVPGEVIHHQLGLMVVGEHQPQYTFTWVVALAVQMMENGAIRLHAAIQTEQWRESGNVRREVYRDSEVAERSELLRVSRRLVDSLVEALPAARSDFDDLRGESHATPA